jgi:hypothetical protein
VLLAFGVVALGSACLGASPAASESTTVQLSDLDGSTTPTSFTLEVDVADASSAKLVVDGRYVGAASGSSPRLEVSVAPGAHKAKVRIRTPNGEVRVDAAFSAKDEAGAPGPASEASAATDTSPTTTANPSTTSTVAPTATATVAPRTSGPTTTATSASREIVVDTVEEIRAALSSARAGDVIRVADGEYQFKPRLVASASGTAEQPIVLVGSRAAVLRTKNASGDYGLHITGDHWRIEGLTVAHGSKGIVLDGSVGTVIDGVEVYDIGAEAVHFRMCSSDGVLRNSYIHDTGRTSAQYGEGVYVGSANSNWDKYQCTDEVEGKTQGDNTERVLVEDNVFEDITAEGADLKEGTDSGTLRRNTFRRTGLSGQNSADSAVDAKGNNWIIEDNVVSETDATWDDDGVARPSEFEDGLQTHSVYDGYGTGNVFRRNEVIGSIPGFGIGLYPAERNVVSCDNSATGAARGLVGNKSKPASCG